MRKAFILVHFLACGPLQEAGIAMFHVGVVGNYIKETFAIEL